MKNKLGMCLVVVLTFASLVMAQTALDSWDNLKQLKAGDRIEVVDMSLHQDKGTFLLFTNEAISYRIDKKDIAVKQQDVFLVTSREKPRRGHTALIGALVGGGISGVLAAIGASKDTKNETGTWVAAVGVSTGIGAGIGAACPTHTPIYRAQKRVQKPKK